jgi:flagellin-like hook-associated protein FlgL
VPFNEDGSSKLTIEGVDDSPTGLGLVTLVSTAFDSDATIRATLGDLEAALGTLRIQSSRLGANLSVAETRQVFMANMADVLVKGAANLTLANADSEGANVLALQTRQQLGSTALSLASQADQNVLRLF